MTVQEITKTAFSALIGGMVAILVQQNAKPLPTMLQPLHWPVLDKTKRQSTECRCDCYWRGKEDGRIEVRKANAELLKKQANEQEWPEGTEKPWWADMPAVN